MPDTEFRIPVSCHTLGTVCFTLSLAEEIPELAILHILPGPIISPLSPLSFTKALERRLGRALLNSHLKHFVSHVECPCQRSSSVCEKKDKKKKVYEI